MRKAVLTFILMMLPILLAAQNKNKAPSNPPEQKLVKAVRTEESIVIDGRLDEKTWQTPSSNGFTQNDPKDGEPATEKTDVWVAYDDQGLYVAAFCYDSEPAKIISRLGRRDAQVDSDWFLFAVDPYYDRRTGYLFGVNPAGSIMDQALSNDVASDSSWDGVWEWKAAINDKGWSVEMRIPFNQIRFPKKEEYVWGVNFRRIIMRKNETASFSWVPKNEAAFVSRFARLEGIGGISPGTHLEFMPYITGQSRFRPAEPGNPFETGSQWLGNAGLDLKFGLKGNLTLDASVNPDFGQVEVDPAVINLSAYETFYQEKRPFFIESASTFDNFGRGGIYMNADMYWPNPQFFYSRRIGRAPQGYVTNSGYVNFPDRSTILSAAKLTGKLGGWNIGFINALTAREFATIDQSSTRIQEEVEPFSYYGVLRAQKDIDGGRHGIGFMATGVMRDTDSQVLNGILNKNAFSTAVDGWSFLDKKRTYVAGGWIGGTRVEGSLEDILRLQYSSMHYFQRPDAAHVEVDPAATSLSGWGGRLQFAKQRGNFIFLLDAGALSPGFDLNDAGFQSRGSDLINFSLLPAYQWTKPGKIFQYALVALGAVQCYDFGWNKIQEAEIILAWQIPHELLKRAKRLQWFSSMGAGNEHLVKNPYLPKEVTLTKATVYGEMMAEYVFAYLLYFNRNIDKHLKDQRKKVWDQVIPGRLRGKVLGILGLGSVGKEIANRGKQFGMNVLGLKRIPGPVENVDQVFGQDDLDRLIPLADYLVDVLPLTPQTHHILGEKELVLLKEGASTQYCTSIIYQYIDLGEFRQSLLDHFFRISFLGYVGFHSQGFTSQSLHLSRCFLGTIKIYIRGDNVTPFFG